MRGASEVSVKTFPPPQAACRSTHRRTDEEATSSHVVETLRAPSYRRKGKVRGGHLSGNGPGPLAGSHTPAMYTQHAKRQQLVPPPRQTYNLFNLSATTRLVQ